MTTEELQVLLSATPFRPFTLQLANGRDLSIKTREFVSHTVRHRMFQLYDDEGGYQSIDLLLVVGATVAPLKPNSR